MDYGSGDCSHYVDFILSNHQVHYIGLDISETAIRRCNERGIQALVHDLDYPAPFADNSFDVAISFEVLEHLFQPEVVLRDIHRVLKPGGVALITVPNVAYLSNRLLFLLGRFNAGGSPATGTRMPWKDPHIRFFTKATLTKLLTETGFIISSFLGSDFSLANFPAIWRFPRINRLVGLASAPLKSLGRYWPSLLAYRFFVAARKPKVQEELSHKAA